MQEKRCFEARLATVRELVTHFIYDYYAMHRLYPCFLSRTSGREYGRKVLDRTCSPLCRCYRRSLYP